MPLVLTHQQSPSYDDLPEVRYHFPRTYLNTLESGIGGPFVYYEPRRVQAGSETAGGRQCYYASGTIVRIESDPTTPDHFYAYVADYLEFDHAVPFRMGDRYYEESLRKDDGSTNLGLFRRSVRSISVREYEAILDFGFKDSVLPLLQPTPFAVEEAPAIAERPLVEQVSRHVFREDKFRQHVRSAYSGTCAMTGLIVANGGGALEVESAHIRPAGGGHNGPDSVRNGIALSRTVHWLFDHGYVSIQDGGEILVASRGVPDKVLRLLHENRQITHPADPSMRPHPAFLGYHREHVFKG